MRVFVLVNPGLEELAQQEIKELIKVKAKWNGAVLDLEVKDEQELLILVSHLQSARRVLVALGTGLNEDSWEKILWETYLSSGSSFKVEVENLKGQENRFKVAKEVAGKLFSILEKKKIQPTLNLKRPDLLVLVYVQDNQFYLGVDVLGQELNSRPYRVFTHSASFKGDLAYYFIRKSGFKPGEKLLVGLVKDGTLAIEVALFANKISWWDQEKVSKKIYSFTKFPGFKQLEQKELLFTKKKSCIYACDSSQQNITATRKNAQLAKVSSGIEIQKCSLEDLDVKFSEQELDRVIFQVTMKDEEQLNEIYYQASYILKPKGTLLLIGRGGWQPSISEKFKLSEQGEIKRGESVYHYWLLEKK